MSLKTVFMFSGQGSQYYSMGRDLYDNHDTFRYWMNYCATIAKEGLGLNLVEHIFKERTDKYEPFTRTLHTSPAIFMVNYSVAQTLMDEGVEPDIVVGYSLGELVALAVSGFVSLEDALHFVLRSARLVENKTPPASMLAILDSPDIFEIYATEFADTTIASLNFRKSFVITGLVNRLKEVQQFLTDKHVLTQLLPIDRGFHSPLIETVRDEYESLLDTLAPEASSLPVVSSAYSRQLHRKSLTPEYYWDLIRRPVLFEKTIQMLEDEGSYVYIDAGPSGTLATFVKYLVQPGSTSIALPVLDQFGYNRRNLQKVCAAATPMNYAQRKYA